MDQELIMLTHDESGTRKMYARNSTSSSILLLSWLTFQASGLPKLIVGWRHLQRVCDMMTFVTWRRLLVILILIVTSASANARDFYVRKNGNDSRAGTSPANAWASLKRVSQETLAIGDTVYVGAGTYDGTTVFNKMSTRPVTTKRRVRGGRRTVTRTTEPTTNSIRFIADVNGAKTGDRGDVILRGDAGNYAMQLEAMTLWEISGFRFQSQHSTRSGHGIQLNRGCTKIIFRNCLFEEVVTGIYAYSNGSNSAHPRCTYDVLDCQFLNGTGYDIQNLDFSEVTVSGCRFTHTSGQTGGIHAGKQSNCEISSSVFVGGTYGVNASESSDVLIQGSSFDGLLYPAIGTSDTALIDKCTVKEAAYGAWIQTEVEPIQIADSSFSNSAYGVLIPKLGVSFDNVSINDNAYGLWIDARLKDITLDPSLKISLQRNKCAICVESRTDGSRPQITVDSFDFADAESYSILCHTGDITVRNCQFSRNAISIYATSNAKSLSIRNCRFANSSSNWQVVSNAASSSVRDSSFKDCSHGVVVHPVVMVNLDVGNLSFENGTYGVLAYNSKVDVTQNSNVRFNGVHLGWYFINSNCAFSKTAISGCNYPIYVTGGTLSLSDTKVTGGVYPIYAKDFTSCMLARSVVKGGTGWGVYLSGQNVSLSDCTISDNANGIFVQDMGENRQSLVSNLTVENNSNWGAYWVNSSFSVSKNQKSCFLNNGYGLGFYQRDFSLGANSGIEISGNNCGIYVNRGDVTLDDVILSGNTHGVQHYHGALTCRNSSIRGEVNGVCHTNGLSVVVSNTTFSGHTGNGLLVQNSDVAVLKQSISIRDSVFSDNGVGLSVSVLPDASVSLQRTAVRSGSGNGVVIYNAKTDVINSSITGNRGYGLMVCDAPATVVETNFSDNGGYALYARTLHEPQMSSLAVRRNQFHRNAYGIGTQQISSGEIVNNLISGGSYGVVSHVGAGLLDVWNNTIVDAYVGIYHHGGRARVKNNIISYGDRASQKASSYGLYRLNNAPIEAGNNLLFGQSCKYYGTTRGPGDVVKPPRFVDRLNGNYELAMGSPAINAGIDARLILTTDIANNVRPAFRGFEIGAYEYMGRSGSVRIIDWKESPRLSRQ